MKRICIPILLAVSFIGCNDDKQDSAGVVAPYAGQTLSLHFPESEELSEFLDPFVEEWNARTGAEAVLVPYADAAAANLEPGDILLAGIADVSSLSTRLAVVPDGTPGRDELAWSKLLPGLRDRVVKRGREPRLVPISCPPLVCYYRQDLLKAAGLEPPTTWLEYNSLVKSIEDWAPGLKAVEPWHANSRAMMFAARSVGYASPRDSIGLFFDTDTGKPQLATAGFVRAMEHFQLVAGSLAHCWDMTPEQCRSALLSGEAAIGIGYEPVTIAPIVDRVEGQRLGFCQLPGSKEVFSRSLKEWDNTDLNRPTLAGFDGHVACVIETDDKVRVKAAFSLLASIVEATTATDGSPLRGFTANWHGDVAPGMFEPQLSIDEATDYVSVSLQALYESDVVLFMPVPNAGAFAESLAKNLTAESVTSTSASDLLKLIEDEWTQISEADSDFVDAYRRNLGLREKK
jgi:ABC-type glycerol-3-phosphate transport system substrate-binding protein